MKNIIHSVVTTQNRPVVVDFRFSQQKGTKAQSSRALDIRYT